LFCKGSKMKRKQYCFLCNTSNDLDNCETRMQFDCGKEFYVCSNCNGLLVDKEVADKRDQDET